MPEQPLELPPLTRELFQTLLAIGWIDGELVPVERDGILNAAVASGLPAPDVADLRRMSAQPVTFADMRFDDLDDAQRLLIYAVASWVAQVDDAVTEEEQAALHAIATLLGVTGIGRMAMDEAVHTLRATVDAPGRLDIDGLYARIGQHVVEAAQA